MGTPTTICSRPGRKSAGASSAPPTSTSSPPTVAPGSIVALPPTTTSVPSTDAPDASRTSPSVTEGRRRRAPRRRRCRRRRRGPGRHRPCGRPDPGRGGTPGCARCRRTGTPSIDHRHALLARLRAVGSGRGRRSRRPRAPRRSFGGAAPARLVQAPRPSRVGPCWSLPDSPPQGPVPGPAPPAPTRRSRTSMPVGSVGS